MVIAPANTGKDNNNNQAVTYTDQTNKGNLCIVKPRARIFITVTIKLIAPNKLPAPDKCKLKIAKSTAVPAWPFELNGGYTVQPVPGPSSKVLDKISNNKDGGNNQKLILFKRGNAISGAPIIKGTNKLPKPPIKTGITIKKIITKA
jgi:hypothetical protein